MAAKKARLLHRGNARRPVNVLERIKPLSSLDHGYCRGIALGGMKLRWGAMQLRLFCVLAIALLIPAQDAGAQQIKLKASLQVPIDNPTFGAGLARLKEEVERLSENAIVIEISRTE